MKNLFYKLINVGVRPTHDFVEKQGIRLSNTMVLVGASGAFINLIMNVFIFNNLAAYVIIAGFLLIVLLVLGLNYMQKPKLAQLSVIFLTSVFVTFLLCLHGRGIGAEFMYLMLGFASIIFFKLRLAIPVLIFIVCCFIWESTFLHLNTPLYADELTGVSEFFYFGIAFLMIVIMTWILISDNRRYTLIIRSKNELLGQQNQELQMFTQIASHDLKSPLRNISSFSGLAMRKYKSDDSTEVLAYLENIERNALKMGALIEDLMVYLKLNVKDGEIDFKDSSLKKVIEEVQLNLAAEIKESSAIFTIEPLPDYVCNHTRFVIVFQNLLQNALKFNEGVPQINISGERLENFIHIHVKDNGIGIDEVYWEKIFDYFQRLHVDEHYTGTGLGLTICKRIIEEMGGDIYVKSKLEKGSVFTIELPLS